VGERNGCTRTCGQEMDAWEKGKRISIRGTRCQWLRDATRGGNGKQNEPVAGARAEEICGHVWKLESPLNGSDLKLTWDAVVAGKLI
jgi:hypothetical protein